MPDTILELMTRVNGIDAVKSGMNEIAGAVSSSTSKMKTDIASYSASSMAANQGVVDFMSKLPPAFIKVEAGGVFAFEQIQRRVIEATSEVGALRQEILSTIDSAKLTQLNAQLEQARARMTAARTELRAMRLEMNETREKADLLGDSVGVQIPGAFGRLLGQMPQVQSLMNALFAPTLVLFFAESLNRAAEGIANMAREMGGFGEAQRKAYESALDHNQRMILLNLKIQEGMERISIIGKEGAAKYAAEAAVAEGAAKREGDELGRVNRALQDQQELVNRLAQKKAIFGDGQVVKIPGVTTIPGLDSVAEELEQAQSKLRRFQEERDELEAKGRERKPEKGAADASEAARKADEARAIQRAATDANKSLQNEYVSFYEQSLRRMYDAEKITLADEVAGEKEAILARLQIERDFAAQRKKELAAEGATGKNVAPQVTAVNTQLAEAELRSRSAVAAIDQKFNLQTLQERNAVNLATVQAAKTTADAEIAVVEETSRRRFANGQIVLSELTGIEKSAANQRIDEQRAVVAEQLRAASEFPEKNKALIVKLNSDLANLERQRVREIEAIDLEAENRKRQVLAIEQEAAKEHQQVLLEIERIGIESRASIGLISNRQRFAQLQVITTQEYQLEKDSIEKKRALYQQGTTQYEQAEKELQQINDRYNKQMAEDDAAALRARFAAWEKFDHQITDGFASAVGEMLRGQKTFGQALAGVWNGMVVDFAQMLTRWLVQWTLQHTAMRVISNVFHLQELTRQIAARTAQATADTAARTADVAQTAVANVAKTTSDAGYTAAHVAAAGVRSGADLASIGATLPATILANVSMVVSDAGVAGAAGFASVMEALPFPANIATAPGIAATAAALTLGFVPLASAAGGMDVKHDQLALIHKNEMVLPESIARNFRALHGSAGPGAAMAALHGGGSVAPRAQGATRGATQINHTHRWQIDARGANEEALLEKFDNQIVPRIKRAFRDGELENIR